MSKNKDDVGKCRSCGAEIVWAITRKGKNMPCDIAPSGAGDFFLFREKDGIDAVHRYEKSERGDRARARNQNRHASHFVTCPSAGERRR